MSHAITNPTTIEPPASSSTLTSTSSPPTASSPPIIPLERAIKEWIPDDEPPDLWDQTPEFPGDWNQCRNPELRETDLGDGRIRVPWFD